ncbi:hypothetical protein CEXT_154371 [Caerostris extrusa]|uniref:Uncharacterized protein n=1 Tax=Caerostris extrusa TaxID=172846 RepID=A0AAV4XGZ2_CAEEX|nr:hypothetical protein CEXT_154371 [Caerostris extrusa]
MAIPLFDGTIDQQKVSLWGRLEWETEIRMQTTFSEPFTFLSHKDSSYCRFQLHNISATRDSAPISLFLCQQSIARPPITTYNDLFSLRLEALKGMLGVSREDILLLQCRNSPMVVGWISQGVSQTPRCKGAADGGDRVIHKCITEKSGLCTCFQRDSGKARSTTKT